MRDYERRFRRRTLYNQAEIDRYWERTLARRNGRWDSWNGIGDRALYLRDRALESGDTRRAARIEQIARRYQNNIERSRSFQRSEAVDIRNMNRNPYSTIYSVERDYSRRTYMGLNNG